MVQSLSPEAPQKLDVANVTPKMAKTLYSSNITQVLRMSNYDKKLEKLLSFNGKASFIQYKVSDNTLFYHFLFIYSKETRKKAQKKKKS